MGLSRDIRKYLETDVIKWYNNTKRDQLTQRVCIYLQERTFCDEG